MNVHKEIRVLPSDEIVKGPVRLARLPEGLCFSLRLDPADAGAASKAFGLELPTEIGGRSAAGDRSALCLGPDEWELLAPEGDGEAILAAFAAIYESTPHSLTEIGDRQIMIEVEGERAADLLSVGCPIDLDRFAPGSGRRTLFDSVQIVLYRDAEDRFRLSVWRSFLPHVWGLLTLANRELAAGL